MAAGPSEAPRFPLAGGLRAVAALAIVVHHVGSATTFSSENRLGGVTARMDVGVAIFFALSAFLLYRPWVAARLHGTAPPRLTRYLRRRAQRIAPAYWVALLVLGVAGWITIVDGEWWRFAFFLQVYDPRTALAGIPPAWSLAVEVSFYLVLPLWALGAGRVLRGLAAATQVRAELAGLAVLAVASLILRAAHFDREIPPDTVLLTLPAFADWFALGMALAVLSAAGWRPGPRAFAVWPVAFLALLAGSELLDLPRVLAAPESTLSAVAGHALYGFVGALLVLPVLDPDEGTLGGRLLTSPVAAWLGLVSYGLFLWHLPLLDQVVDTGLAEAVPQASFAAVLVATLAAGLAAAALSWYLVERPLLDAGRRR